MGKKILMCNGAHLYIQIKKKTYEEPKIKT